MPQGRHEGFTLIEISIVLVIIGLIVGGVLVGQDLIRAAGVRAQISQIEKYQTAVNTFRGKYGALPGDLNDATARQSGFAQRGAGTGQGDGNGVLEGWCGGGYDLGSFMCGENTMFWVDLTSANGLNVNLIDGSFTTATPTDQGAWNLCCNGAETALDLYFPRAAVGGVAHIYVYSANGTNYFGLGALHDVLGDWGYTGGFLALTVYQAYNIDRKVDDGFPLTGTVIERGVLDPVDYGPWIYGGLLDAGGGFIYSPDFVAVPPSAVSCIDNGGVVGGLVKYSISRNTGGVNCVLSLKANW